VCSFLVFNNCRPFQSCFFHHFTNSLLSPYFWLPPTCSVDVQWTGSHGYVFPFPWLYHTFYSVSSVRDTDEDHSFGESNVLICCYLSRVTDAMGSPRLLMRQTWIIGTVWIIQISDAHTWTQLNYFNIYIYYMYTFQTTCNIRGSSMYGGTPI
jgi:hypothetical protein